VARCVIFMSRPSRFGDSTFTRPKIISVRKRLLCLLLLAPLAPVALVIFMVIDANLQHWLGQYWMLGAVSAMTCLFLLLPHQPADPRPPKPVRKPGKPGDCACCCYDLRADRGNPNYCPQCGSSQSPDAHFRRRRQLMLELERLQKEFVRNHRARATELNRIHRTLNGPL
jgi:hypothetical protein